MKRLDQALAETKAQLHILRAAMEHLDRAIGRTDRPVPCRTPGANLWLSDRAKDRAEAAQLCAGCPVLGECRAVAETEPWPTGGVWAGQDYSTRTVRRARTAAAGPTIPAGTSHPEVGQRTVRIRQLLARGRTEVDELADPRVTRLREVTADPLTSSRATVPPPQTRELRRERARLVVELRQDDPDFWTTVRLAAAADVSPSTITDLLRDANIMVATGRSR